MAKAAELEKLTGLASRFGAFIAERHPFALRDALDAFEKATGGRNPGGEKAIDAARAPLRRELKKRLDAHVLPGGLPDTTPRTTAAGPRAEARAQPARAAGRGPGRARRFGPLAPAGAPPILRGL